jgi:Pentapeptide repeats (8 copies)
MELPLGMACPEFVTARIEEAEPPTNIVDDDVTTQPSAGRPSGARNSSENVKLRRPPFMAAVDVLLSTCMTRPRRISPKKACVAGIVLLGMGIVMASCGTDAHENGGTTVTSSSSGDHHAVDDAGDGHEEHVVRDPATQPCDVTNWRGFMPDLRECVLPGQNLEGEVLRRVDLSDADLTGTNLIAADLFTAILARAKLVNANCSQAHMVGVDLTGADLTGANLKGADLTNAIVANTTLAGVMTDETTVCPNLMFGPCW